MPQYIYKLIREDWTTGTRAKRPRIIIRDKPDLQVGGLYVHLGKGYPGCQRVVSVEIREEKKDDH
ncbi:MAG: hypothetical protein OSJ71_06570 [Acetatifactor sp.]|nr:hypothetical protein [Acetatifactor sp.]